MKRPHLKRVRTQNNLDRIRLDIGGCVFLLLNQNFADWWTGLELGRVGLAQIGLGRTRMGLSGYVGLVDWDRGLGLG